MNKGVTAYEEAFSGFLGSGRTLEQILKMDLDSVIRDAVDRSVRFRKAMDSYQNLSVRSTIADAEKRFNRLKVATAAMVEAANGFVTVTAMILSARARP